MEDVEDDEDEEENVDVDLDVVEEDLDYDGENDEEDGGGEEPFPEVVRKDDNVEGSQTPVDDDEDKKNPQYIPKKGMFYEHDNRQVFTQKIDKKNITIKTLDTYVNNNILRIYYFIFPDKNFKKTFFN